MDFESSEDEEPVAKRHCSTPIRHGAVSRRGLLEEGEDGGLGEEAIAPIVAENCEQREGSPDLDQHQPDDEPRQDYFGLSVEDMGKASCKNMHDYNMLVGKILEGLNLCLVVKSRHRRAILLVVEVEKGLIVEDFL